MFLECLSQLLYSFVKIKKLRTGIGAPISCCKKNPLFFIRHLFPPERYRVCTCHIFIFFAPFLSIRYVPLWPRFFYISPFTYHFPPPSPYLIYFPICVCQTCLLNPDPIVFIATCFKEDCAWVRMVIHFYCIFNPLFLNFVVTKWTSCAVYGAVLSHIVSSLCVHYWFVIVRFGYGSSITSYRPFPTNRLSKALPLLHILTYRR